MATVTVAWADDHLRRYGKKIDELNRRFPKVLPRVINQVGNRAKTQVIRKLTKQTGLQQRVVVDAVKVTMAGGKRLSCSASRSLMQPVAQMSKSARRASARSSMSSSEWPGSPTICRRR